MAYQLFQLPKAQAFASGRVAPGAKLSFYLTGTSTPTPVYTTSALTTTHTQPVVADSAGVFAATYIDPTITYKVTVTDANNVLLYTVDPVNDQILSQGMIGAYLYPKTTAETAAGVTPVNYAYPPYHSARYGAVGDGVTDDTAALQDGIDATPSGGAFTFEPGKNFLITALTVSQNILIECTGSAVTLSGDNAGLYLHGTITRADIIRWNATGDGVSRDADSSKIQCGISIGNDPGDNISDVTIWAPRVNNANVGIRVAYGTSPNTVVQRVAIIDPRIFNSIGYVGGTGYGIQFTQAPGSYVLGGYIYNCQRHGLYFSEGENYRADSVEVTECGKGDGTIRGAIACSRSAKVALVNMHVHDNNDVGCAVDSDAQGITPQTCQDVSIVGGVWKDNDYGDIIVGTSSDPATDGAPRNLSIKSVNFRTKSTPGGSIINVKSVNGLDVRGCVFDASTASTGTYRIVTLSDTGGSPYSQNITIKNNQFRGGGGATTYCFQVASSMCTSSVHVDLRDNDFYSVSEEFEFLAGENSVTNNNLAYNRRNGGGGVRTYSSSGTNISVPVGYLETLTMSASGATTLQTLTGGREGQELAIYFTNGNTDVKVTSIYLAGAVDFTTPDANDVLMLKYIGGAWREISRSAN